MHQVSIEQAARRLKDLVELAARGEEVVLVEDQRAVARLVPWAAQTQRVRPQFGSARGLIEMADDFDAPLQDFREYME